MASYNFSNSLLNGYQTTQPSYTNNKKPESLFSNPFKDPSTVSRTTASGFTDMNHLTEEFEAIKMEAFDKMQDLAELHAKPLKDQNLTEIKEAQEDIIRFNHRISALNTKIQLADLNKNLTPPESPEMVNRKLEDDIMSTITDATVRPKDSASMIQPPKASTRLTTYSGIRSSVVRGSDHDKVVGGYELTPEDHMTELEAINNIQTVYGLPRIFIDDRLNFLVHLHKPLQSMLTTKNQSKVTYPDPNSLEKLTRFIDRSKGRTREPHAELLYQVLKATIDIRRMRIKANPFNLPILEVGMHLDDQLVYMSITELYSEFRTSWFHSMKNVEPPHFASEYVGVCSATPKKQTSRPVSGERRKKRGSSSILGSILSA